MVGHLYGCLQRLYSFRGEEASTLASCVLHIVNCIVHYIVYCASFQHPPCLVHCQLIHVIAITISEAVIVSASDLSGLAC
jgi:hypothetical protein